MSPMTSAAFGQMNPEGIGTMEALVIRATTTARTMAPLSQRLAPVLPESQIKAPVNVMSRKMSR